MDTVVSNAEIESARALNADVKPFETGLIFWTESDANTTFEHLKGFGLRAAQVGIAPALDCHAALPAWRKADAEFGVSLTGAAVAYAGEDYSSLARVHESVGFTTPAYRAERIARTREAAAFASALGITSLSCHIGFIPESPADFLYDELLQVTRTLCDACDDLDMNFALETGQESAAVLLGFLSDVDKPNLKVNFDPANMVMYGSGYPVEALALLRPWVLSVHCKDGVGPETAHTLGMGREVRLGDGAVDFPAFLHLLKAMEYKGTLTIEREEPDHTQRDVDIRTAIERLQQWKSAVGIQPPR